LASTDVKTIELVSPSGVRFEVGADIDYVAALVRQLG
jgi:hypothetical protein